MKRILAHQKLSWETGTFHHDTLHNQVNKGRGLVDDEAEGQRRAKQQLQCSAAPRRKNRIRRIPETLVPLGSAPRARSCCRPRANRHSAPISEIQYSNDITPPNHPRIRSSRLQLSSFVCWCAYAKFLLRDSILAIRASRTEPCWWWLIAFSFREEPWAIRILEWKSREALQSVSMYSKMRWP